jgi:hypothetical protein
LDRKLVDWWECLTAVKKVVYLAEKMVVLLESQMVETKVNMSDDPMVEATAANWVCKTVEWLVV